MTYEQCLEYLANLNKFGMNFGLGRIDKLLELMGRPERRYKTIHIAGTNGKGSTAAMLASVLKAAGLKSALYTSPHLIEYTERMIIDGKQITKQDFAAAIKYTADFVEQVTAAGYEHPTEFEVLTAAAFYYFAAAGVEYAVIEAGLGGLLDSTNVITPLVAVITNVTLEHTDRCGGTVREIAWHKAGIIKENIPVVTAADGDALAVISETAVAKNAPLAVLGRNFSYYAAGINGYRQKFSFSADAFGDINEINMNLLGSHQLENGALAAMTALLLADKDRRISPDAIKAGMVDVKWPGRFEVFDRRPVIVIDSAHNPAGANALRASLDEVFPEKPITFLAGFLADKDIASIVETLVRPCDSAIIVRPFSDRAADPAKVASLLSASRLEVADSLDGGFLAACSIAGPDGVVCIAGSLYLTGPARELVKVDKKNDWRYNR